jgi:phosphoglycerate dehydrogenase-like enzyme
MKEADPVTATADRNAATKTVVMITSPLELEYAERIAAAEPERVEVIYRPDLMPPTRYQGDHNGPEDWPGFESRRAEWHRLLARAEVLWDFPTHEQKGILELSPKLRWVQTSSAGVGQYVKRLGLQESDLIVTTASGVHGEPLTEFVFAALLHYVKWIPQIQEWQRNHEWVRFCSDELTGKTLAIVGPGRIGREVARIGRAFGMTTWAMAATYDPARTASLNVDRLFRREELREMLAGADAVVLCTPHTAETENLIGAGEIEAFKPGIVLVNIARGLVIDEEAMIAALRSGKIAFAALDVYRIEPLPVDSPLWDLPNVLINPHSASTAPSENSKITEIFIRNLRCYLDGRYEEMSPVLDKMRLY